MNTASRIVIYVNKVAGVNTKLDKPAAAVWAGLLAHKTDLEPLGETAIALRLIELCTEVDVLIATLEARGIPNSLYEREFKSLKTTFSPARVHVQWGHVNQSHFPIALRSLEWAEFLIGNIEESVPQEDLEGLLKHALELNEIIVRPGFPIGLRMALERQISAIHAALANYPIHGVQPLKEAASVIVGSVALHADEFKAAVESDDGDQQAAISKMKNVVESVSGSLQKADKTISSVKSLYNTVAPLLKMAGDMFQQGPNP